VDGHGMLKLSCSVGSGTGDGLPFFPGPVRRRGGDQRKSYPMWFAANRSKGTFLGIGGEADHPFDIPSFSAGLPSFRPSLTVSDLKTWQGGRTASVL